HFSKFSNFLFQKKKMIKCSILYLLLITYILSFDIKKFIQDKEEAVKNLCEAVENYYDSVENRNLDLAYCPYYDGCLRSDMNMISGMQCRKGFGKDVICGCETN